MAAIRGEYKMLRVNRRQFLKQSTITIAIISGALCNLNGCGTITKSDTNPAENPETSEGKTKGTTKMQRCENCKMRARYDNNPQSFLGRVWKWHIEWCPGWKSYIKSLPEEKRMLMMKKYG